MPRTRRITFASSAIDDLLAIRKWFAGQQVPDVGERLLCEVVDQAERLAESPEMGRMVPEFGVPHLGEIIRAPYRIVYRLDAEWVRVVRVWRSERLLEMPDHDG